MADSGVGMSQTLLVVVLFIGAVAMLPWLVRYVQQHKTKRWAWPVRPRGVIRHCGQYSSAHRHRRSRPEYARTCLVLGVTAQHITCLHVVGANAPANLSVAAPSFSHEWRRVRAARRAASTALCD